MVGTLHLICIICFITDGDFEQLLHAGHHISWPMLNQAGEISHVTVCQNLLPNLYNTSCLNFPTDMNNSLRVRNFPSVNKFACLNLLPNHYIGP